MEKNTAKLLVAGLKRLLRERKQVDDAIDALQAVLGKHSTGTGSRASMGDDARLKISNAMKARWAKKRGKKAAPAANPLRTAPLRTAPRVAGRKTPIHPSAALAMTRKHSVPEIAEKLNLSEYQVRALIKKAKANLKNPKRGTTEEAAAAT